MAKNDGFFSEKPPDLFDKADQQGPLFGTNSAARKSSAAQTRSANNLKHPLSVGLSILAASSILIFCLPKVTSSCLRNAGEFFDSCKCSQLSLNCYNAALALSPQDADCLLKRGSLQSDAENYDAAMRDLNEVISLSPSTVAYLARGRIQYKMHKIDSAILDFTDALKRDPLDVEALTRRAQAYSRLGRYNQALADYSQASKLDPADVEAKNGWQQTFDLQYDETMEHTGSAKSDAQHSAKAKANATSTGAQIVAAATLPSSPTAAKSSGTEAWREAYARGLTETVAHHYGEAIRQFNLVIKDNPGYTGAYLKKGVVYYEMHKYGTAIQCFDQAIALDPNDFKPYYCRGLAHDQSGHFKEAVPDYSRAMALDRSNATVYHKLIEADFDQMRPGGPNKFDRLRTPLRSTASDGLRSPSRSTSKLFDDLRTQLNAKE